MSRAHVAQSVSRRLRCCPGNSPRVLLAGLLALCFVVAGACQAGASPLKAKKLAAVRSATAGTRVTVDSQQHNAFPSITKAGSTYVAAWRQGSAHLSHDGDIFTSTTTKSDGTGWTVPVAKLTSSVLDLRDPGLTYAGGVLYMSYFTSDATHPAKGVYVTRSTNGGTSFGAGVRVDGGMPFAAESGSPLALADGSLLMPFYGHQAGEAFDSVWVSTSTNGGDSWGTPVRVMDGPADGRDYQEPVATATSSGPRLYFRWGHDDRIGSVDLDGGAWGNARPLFAGTGRAGCQDNGGTVACIYRSTADTGTALLRTSTDDGDTWSDASTFDATSSYMTYAGLTPVGSGWLVFYAMQQSSVKSTVYARTLTA